MVMADKRRAGSAKDVDAFLAPALVRKLVRARIAEKEARARARR
jgi:hypothetical protein